MNMKMENGKTYKVNHCRKGRFEMHIDHQNDNWITGTIIEGRADATMAYNEKLVGDKITVRKSHLRSVEEIGERDET